MAAVSGVWSKNPGSQRSAYRVDCVALGCTDHWASSPSTPPAAASPAPSSPSVMSVQRVRPTPWVQVKRAVPVVYSRASNGAPRNTPMITGTACMARMTWLG